MVSVTTGALANGCVTRGKLAEDVVVDTLPKPDGFGRGDPDKIEGVCRRKGSGPGRHV